MEDKECFMLAPGIPSDQQKRAISLVLHLLGTKGQEHVKMSVKMAEFLFHKIIGILSTFFNCTPNCTTYVFGEKLLK